MAKFNLSFQDGARGAYMDASKQNSESLGLDDILEVLRPAAMRLKEIYQEAIRSTFQQRTGSLAESIDFEDDTVGKNYACFIVKPFGSHKGGMYQRKSRAGDSSARYAKRNRNTSKKKLKNEELAYLLEYGTPRISPGTHWMENANESAEEEVQQIIEDGYDALLKKKGLI